jgi:hypothetical protein
MNRPIHVVDSVMVVVECDANNSPKIVSVIWQNFTSSILEMAPQRT